MRSTLSASAHYQYGQLAMGENLLRFADQDQSADAAASVRGHTDQIAGMRLCGGEDQAIWMVVESVHQFICNLRSRAGVHGILEDQLSLARCLTFVLGVPGAEPGSMPDSLQTLERSGVIGTAPSK